MNALNPETKEAYQAPDVEVLEMSVEHGFAASSGGTPAEPGPPEDPPSF